MTKIVFICVLTFFSCVSSSDVNNDYFVHPKDRPAAPTTGPRIIGGQEVKPHSYPFQTALLVFQGSNEYFCGGTLLSNQWVLTAAHCIGSPRPEYILVVLGDHNLSDIDASVVVLNSTSYVVHKNWDSNTFQNDVALVKLPRNITFTDYIKPVELAEGTNKYEGEKATILGWGATETEDLSYVLRSVNSSIMNNDDCANMNVNYKEIIKPMHICASGSGKVGSCSGDSGGPLIVNGKQVGIVSFGTKDCTLSMPSVFTRVTTFHDWITTQMAGGASKIATLSIATTALFTLFLSYFFR